RLDSLVALRRGIRELTQSGGVNLPELLDDIYLRLQEIDRLLGETFIQKWARRTQVVLGLENIGATAIAGAVAELVGHSVQLPPGIGALIGVGASGALHLAQKRVAPQFLLPDRVRDFYYVYEVERFRT